LLAACAVVLCCAGLLVVSSGPMPIVWDEGDTIVRAEAIAAVADRPQVNGPLQYVALLRDEAHWPYTIKREGHPPLAGIVIAIGSWLAPGGLDPLTAFRLGPIVLFSLAAGAMFYRLTRDYRAWPVSLFAVAVLLTMPRLFAHAHFATLDGPLTACWLLAWAAFSPACRKWRFTPLFGLALGLTLCAKFTGWLAVLPFAFWAILYRDRGGLRALCVGVPVAVLVFLALNPPLWSQPIDGLRTFFVLNLSRGDRAGLNISTQFLGRMYNLDYPLPWYNTLFWTAITVSPLSLLFGCLGIVATLRRWKSDRASMLLIFQWATLVIARALPIAPPHDGVRLFLPSFAFFAALSGVGAGRALYRDTLLPADGPRIIAQGWAKVALVLALLAAVFDAVSYYPHGLSYYNRLIGGLRGAVALGMEPTYYWDSLDRATLSWLSQNTKIHTAPPKKVTATFFGGGEKIAFGAAPARNLGLLKRWGLLGRLPSERGTFRWYVLQRRPSAHQPADLWLIENAQPAFERSLFGVPLLDVYSYDQYRRAVQSVESPGSGVVKPRIPAR
jgi:Dolichyl-phosphate-mannose-protein mannosyltransferase